MKWLRRRDDDECPDQPNVEKARRDLERVKAETAHTAALAESLRRIRERNHFAESLEAILRERR